MEIQLKQRLIGAIVVFTLLIIFLPMVFQNNSDQDYVEQILEPPIPQDIKDKKVIIDKYDKSPDEIIQDQLMQALPNKAEEQQGKADSMSDESDIDMDDLALQTDAAVTTKLPLAAKKLEHKPLTRQPVVQAETRQEESSIVKEDNVAVVDSKTTDKKAAIQMEEKLENQQKSNNVNPNKLALAKENVTNVDSSNRIIYKVGSEISKGQVFAIRVGSFPNSVSARTEKSKLLALGLPAYINKNANRFDLFVGPELEFKYVKELALRIKNETNYKAEVLAHDSRWVTE